ncbi:MAG: adenosylcobinamide-GDP ribazoletransferase, partial [Rikenellaceae bacterium]
SSVLWAASLIMPLSVAVMVAMVAMLLTTGAFHEDGLADFADGFGAGYDKENIMRIMKDSHIGTYGVITLACSILLKFLLISSLAQINVEIMDTLVIMVLAQSTSRFTPIVMLSTTPYVRSEKSKATHASRGISALSLIVAGIIAIAPLTLLGWKAMSLYLAIGSLLIIVFRAYTRRKIEGCTGDTLGALQQIAEILFYITIFAAYNL